MSIIDEKVRKLEKSVTELQLQNKGLLRDKEWRESKIARLIKAVSQYVLWSGVFFILSIEQFYIYAIVPVGILTLRPIVMKALRMRLT